MTSSSNNFLMKVRNRISYKKRIQRQFQVGLFAEACECLPFQLDKWNEFVCLLSTALLANWYCMQLSLSRNFFMALVFWKETEVLYFYENFGAGALKLTVVNEGSHLS